MKDQAIQYYQQGYNCSQCILKAAEERFQVSVPSQSFHMCSGIRMGFGIGGICSALVGGIMVFGLMFEEEAVKRLSIKLLTMFHERFDTLQCSKLKNQRDQQAICDSIVGEAAAIIEQLIVEEKGI